jgi:hypothetical protein
MVDGSTSDTQERQSVYDYFFEKYSITLKHPNLPTVGKNKIKFDFIGNEFHGS